ncbi:MAG: hypothetical protein RLZZ15_2639 [Verrucomicrobiota bacterium]
MVGLLVASAVRAGAAELAIRRELFLASPRAGTAVLAATYYTRPSGGELLSLHQLMSRSDTVDVAFLRTSSDQGRTWSEPLAVPTLAPRDDGKFRRALRGGVADPRTGRFVRFQIEGLLPTDDPLEGMRQWYLTYQVSADGGRTWPIDEQIIQRGAEFSPSHPLPGVWIGRNSVMVGDLASVPLVLADGTFIVPVVITPLGPDGKYFNPGGGYTYHDAAVLRGRWREGVAGGNASSGQGGNSIDWELSALVKADPARSTRGMDEPTVAPLADGRLLMVLRGSNGGKPALPGRRWAAWSRDAGRTWTAPAPWTYADGDDFFSPSACSQLVPHSSGRLFWIGNIVPQNPAGNQPRTPLVIGEVDVRSGLLRRDTVRVIDERQPGDSPLLALSNFSAREDRETAEIVVNLSRLFERSPPEPDRDWTSDAYLFRVPVK